MSKEEVKEKKHSLAKKMKRDIKEEEKGEKHYKQMAKKHPSKARTFKAMAKDEERHEENLEKM